MERLQRHAEVLGEEAKVSPALIVPFILAFISCLLDEEDNEQERIAHVRRVLLDNRPRVLRSARRHARRAGVPRDQINPVALATVKYIEEMTDEELKATIKDQP